MLLDSAEHVCTFKKIIVHFMDLGIRYVVVAALHDSLQPRKLFALSESLFSGLWVAIGATIDMDTMQALPNSCMFFAM